MRHAALFERFPAVRPGRQPRRAARVAGPARVEGMEPRRLLAANASIIDDGSTITATGTDGADTITIQPVGTDDFQITINSLTRRFDQDDAAVLRVRGDFGNDNITVGTLPGGFVEFSIDGGDGTDTVTVGDNAIYLYNNETIRANGRTVATREADGGLRVLGTAGADDISLTGSAEMDGEQVVIGDYFHGLFGSGRIAYYAVDAGGGNDTLEADSFFAVPARLNAGDGNDSVEVHYGNDATVTGGAGDDSVRAWGEGNLDGFDGGAGTDSLELVDATGVDLNDFPTVENVSGNGLVSVVGNALNNVITVFRGANVRGGGGDDTINGSDEADSLFGEGGNDRIFGNGGDDFIEGGEGNDHLDGGAGTDTTDGGPGDDTEVNGEAPPSAGSIIYDDQTRSVTVTGTAGEDVIRLDRVGADDVRVTLNGATRTFDMDDVGTFSLYGEGSDDTVTALGDFGAVLFLNGGGGRDTFNTTSEHATLVNGDVFRDGTRTVATRDAAENVLVIDGTAGNDDIDLRYGSEGPFVTINGSYTARFVDDEFLGYAVRGGAGNDDIHVHNQFPGDANTGVFVAGEDGNDVFTLDEATRVDVSGGAGDDLLKPMGNPEDAFENVRSFSGGLGVDTIQLDNQGGISLSNYSDVENVTNAHGTVTGNDGDNRITVRPDDTRGAVLNGLRGNDTLIGGAGNDEVYGGEGDDSLFGNAGDDLLDGGPGVDRLEGGSGNNTLVNGESTPQFFIDSSRILVANGTAAADTFRVERVGADDVRITVNGTVRTFDMDDFDRIELNGGDGNDTMTAGAGVRNLTMAGNAGADRLTGNELPNQFYGGTGNDTIDGAGGNDTIYGEAGNDTLNGGSGNDIVFGDDGDDTITGGSGADELRGHAGNDTFFARDNTRDTVDGGGDTDRSQHDSLDTRTSVEQTIP